MDKVMESLYASYTTIVRVNFLDNSIEVLKKNDDLPKAFWDYVASYPSYNELLKTYIEERVVYEEQKEMYDALKYDKLIKAFNRTNAFSYEYRIGKTLTPDWMRARYINVSSGNELTSILICYENINLEMNSSLSDYKIGKKVLVIDDNPVDRGILSDMLENNYTIVEAGDGNEGMAILEEQYEDIAVILVDLSMPVCDGYEFLDKMHNIKRYNSIPVIVTTTKDNKEDELIVLEKGASDYIRKPYNQEIIKHRIDSLIRLKRSISLVKTMEKDPLTGLYTLDKFCKMVEKRLAESKDKDYRIVVSNIEKFKIINDKYGVQTGDNVLQCLAAAFKKYAPKYIFGGRIAGDKFAFFLEDIVQTREEGMNMLHKIYSDCPIHNITIKCGVYRILRGDSIPVITMCDRAKIAAESIKGNYNVHCAVYNEKIRDDFLLHQQIIDSMKAALEEEQFSIYLQPKINARTEKIDGAEALVRWIHPELGFLSPAHFIPIFEQNGFIKVLDRYIFEKVVQLIKKWIDNGIQPIPVSVNFSRVDFENENLADFIIDYVNDIDIEHNLIHIELTETAVATNSAQITGIINKLRDNGFVIELDDFGSGYSSLTALTSIDIDILKLDASIIRNDIPDAEKNILNFCMQLAKMMKILTVAEGAETKEQVNRLKNVGCDYIQGYYYSKPIPINEFEGRFFG